MPPPAVAARPSQHTVDNIVSMMEGMAEEDMEDHANGKPAINKLKKLAEVEAFMCQVRDVCVQNARAMRAEWPQHACCVRMTPPGKGQAQVSWAGGFYSVMGAYISGSKSRGTPRACSCPYLPCPARGPRHVHADARATG